jgi:hypothetical protein
MPVDASGEVIATEANNGPYDGAIELAGMLAQTPEVHDCMARQWFRFSLGRMDDDMDQCTMDQLATAFEESDHDVRSLIREIVLSDAFRYRLAPEEG